MKTSDRPTFYDSQAQCAAQRGVPLATVRGWKAQGCPAFRSGRIYRDELAAWLKARPRAAKPKRVRSSINLSQIHAGAPGALERLEEMEVSSFVELRNALATGDADAIDECRRTWLQISEAVRRHDRALESSRRTAGELLPRAECERVIERIALLVKLSLHSMCAALPPALCGVSDLAEIATSLESLRGEILFQVAAGLASRINRSESPIPSWALAAFRKPLEDAYGADVAREKIDALAKAMDTLMASTAGQLRVGRDTPH